MSEGQFLPIISGKVPEIIIHLDNHPIPAFQGETVICALLRERRYLSYAEFDGAPRSGFCLMGACQDCSVWTQDGERLRACRTIVEEGQKLLSRAPMHGFPV